MGLERTFFERLDLAGKEERSLRPNPGREAQSVLAHLRKMLNVRQGGVLTAPLYGIPDLADLAFRQDAIRELQKAIKLSIEQYEPRLKKVVVEHVPDNEDPLNIHFRITARLVTGENNPPVQFQTSLDTVGKVSIRQTQDAS
jgi:type VI secretion system protein